MPELDPDSVRVLFDGQRLAQARYLKRMLKAELADQVDLSAAAIGQFESGTARPTAATIAKLAAALEVPAPFFAANRPRFVVGEADASFRSLRSTSNRDRAQARAQIELLAEVVQALERRIELPKVDVPAVPDDATPADAAANVRAAWHLADGPIPSVVRLIETKGVIVSRLPAATDEMDAFSCWIEGRPFVVLVSNKAAADRARFDAAHELAHIVFRHESGLGDKANEWVAHSFAAELLTPAKQLVGELPTRLDWRRIAELKLEWGVSMAMLLRRMKDLGKIPDQTYQRGMVEMSRRGWRKVEPVQLGTPEVPELLAIAVQHLGSLSQSADDLSDELALPAKYVHSLVNTAIGDARARVAL